MQIFHEILITSLMAHTTDRRTRAGATSAAAAASLAPIAAGQRCLFAGALGQRFRPSPRSGYVCGGSLRSKTVSRAGRRSSRRIPGAAMCLLRPSQGRGSLRVGCRQDLPVENNLQPQRNDVAKRGRAAVGQQTRGAR